MTRVAAVDLGTNSTRLLLRDVRRTQITHLGEGVDATQRLSDRGIARVHAVLEEYAREIGDVPTLAVGTSAVRDAVNGEEFMRGIAERYGWQTRILTGEEEAKLTRAGVGALDDRTLVLDVGGGSTELIAGAFHVSIDLGSVRLSERHFRSDPPSAAELEAAAAAVRAALPDLHVDAIVGVAGTVSQLEELAGELTLASVEAQLDRLAALTLAERRLVPRLWPERAGTIVAGAIVVREVLRHFSLETMAFSERDLLEGVAGIVASANEL